MTLAIVAAALMAAGCHHTSSTDAGTMAVGGDTVTRHSRLLTIIDNPGYTLAEIRNPWDTTATLQRLILADREATLPAGLPADAQVVRTPVTSSLVYSSVHGALIEELGAIGSVTGVADAPYFKLKAIADGLTDGTVTDVGSSTNPSQEKIIELNPQVILTSPFQNAGHGVIEQLGIPIVECADYMESTPLGRAEWMKLFGRLYGKATQADSLFTVISHEYTHLANAAAKATSKPVVITERVVDGVWYVPGGGSYMARMLADAGASYPWADDASAGSLQLDAPTVLDRAADADYWLIRTYGFIPSHSMLAAESALNSRFKAFNTGGIYCSDTSQSMIFEEFPFHPDLLLGEYIRIFHPGLIAEGDGRLRYYQKID